MPLIGTEGVLATTVCTTLGIIGNADLSQDEIDAAKENWEAIAKDLFEHIIANMTITATTAAPVPVQVVPATGTGATTGPVVPIVTAT